MKSLFTKYFCIISIEDHALDPEVAYVPFLISFGEH